MCRVDEVKLVGSATAHSECSCICPETTCYGAIVNNYAKLILKFIYPQGHAIRKLRGAFASKHFTANPKDKAWGRSHENVRIRLGVVI